MLKSVYIIFSNGNKELVKDTVEFNEIKWLKYKNWLETCYNALLNSKYFDKFDNNRYVFYVLQFNNT